MANTILFSWKLQLFYLVLNSLSYLLKNFLIYLLQNKCFWKESKEIRVFSSLLNGKRSISFVGSMLINKAINLEW